MGIFQDKQPAIIHNNEIYVPSRRVDDNFFDPDKFEFLPLGESKNKLDSYQGLFVKDLYLTLAHQEYQRLKAEKGKTISLLRQALLDEDLPDMTHFPLGNLSDKIGSLTQQLHSTAGRIECTRRIRWLKDTASLPQLREVLFHGDHAREIDKDYIHVKNGIRLKKEVIETLAKLGAKNILVEYITQPHVNIPNGLIKKVLAEFLTMGLTEADLPVLLKLCEHFENSDTDDRFYDEMFLNKLYENNGGIVKGMIYEGIITEYNIESSPMQRLLCKNIAYIKSPKALALLEDMYAHSTYREFQICCLFAIQHWLYLHQLDFQTTGNMSISPLQREKIRNKYDINLLGNSSTKLSARTNKAEKECEAVRKKNEKEEQEQSRKATAKRIAYFKTLKPGDTIEVGIPYDMSDEKVIGTIIENNGKELLIESWFQNKKKMGRRKFSMAGVSKGPAIFIDTGDGNEPAFFRLKVPGKDPGRTIPDHIKIYDLSAPQNSTHDKNGDLIF